MKTIMIRRIITGIHGTFGTIIYENIPFALSLEREWLDNQTGISCIPASEYKCTRCNKSPDYNYTNSPRFGDTFQVRNVKNRSKILFHKGNLDDDSHGCVLVGEQFGIIKGSPGVQASKHGYNEFMDIMKNDDEFRLIVVDDWKNSIN